MAFIYLTIRHGGIRLDCNGITGAGRMLDHKGVWHFGAGLLFTFDYLACHVCKVRSLSLQDGQRQ